MTYLHRQLASGHWQKLTFAEQMAHVGSEVGRAISWKKKGHPQYSREAFWRALELLGLTIDTAVSASRLKELTRLYETLVDYFAGQNQFASSDSLWRNYFSAFNFAARKES